MSVVSNCILAFSVCEDEGARIAEVNRFFRDNQRPFISADSGHLQHQDGLDEKDIIVKLPRGWYGGSKMLETPLYIASFNGFDEKGFIAHLRTNVKWDVPESVQLIIKRQDDDVFSIITLT